MALAQAIVREVMDIRQAAEYLGISGDTLYRYASEGFIPASKLGNRWRFKKTLLDSWMDEKSGVKPVANVTVMPRQKKPAGRARYRLRAVTTLAWPAARCSPRRAGRRARPGSTSTRRPARPVSR